MEVSCQVSVAPPVARSWAMRTSSVILAAASCEQELAGVLAGRLEVVIHRLAGLFRQPQPDGTLGLSLADGRPVGTTPIRRNILDLESDNIAAAQFAIGGQSEQRQIVR